ncbi:MAG: trypsin-like peptidase domain-containing protein [Verrucomicrobiia bacterium]
MTVRLRRHILPGMKRCARQLVLVAALALSTAYLTEVRAETESIDLKALAKKARPAVMLLVVSDTTGKEVATGTGFLVSSDGKLITNHHVIEGAASAVAKAENGGLFPIEGVLADDPKNDLVLLKLTGKDLPFLTLGNSEKIEVGTRIAVIGSPLGLEGTLSEGIVSAVREGENKERMLQITAAISHGSSGSPVLDAKGEVIGVATALLREGQSLNFAIPVDAAQYLLAKGRGTMSPKSFGIISGREMPDFFDLIRDADFRASRETMEKGDYAEALKHIKAVLTRFPNSADAYVQLGRVYSSLKFVDEAAAAYEEATKILKHRIRTQPDDDGAWSSLAELYEAQGKSADAVVAYKQAAKIAAFPGPWSDLGAAYMRQRDYGNAIEAYQQAIKLLAEKVPDSRTNRFEIALSGTYWSNLGDAYLGAGKMSDAIDAYKKAVKLGPDNADAWYGLGSAYRTAGQEALAADAFQRARALKPELFK